MASLTLGTVLCFGERSITCQIILLESVESKMEAFVCLVAAMSHPQDTLTMDSALLHSIE